MLLTVPGVAWLLCRVTMLEEEIGRMNPDLGAIAAYRAKEEEYAQRVKGLEAATQHRDQVNRQGNQASLGQEVVEWLQPQQRIKRTRLESGGCPTART